MTNHRFLETTNIKELNPQLMMHIWVFNWETIKIMILNWERIAGRRRKRRNKQLPFMEDVLYTLFAFRNPSKHGLLGFILWMQPKHIPSSHSTIFIQYSHTIFFIHEIENSSQHLLSEFFFLIHIFSAVSKMVPNLNLPCLFTIWSLN